MDYYGVDKFNGRVSSMDIVSLSGSDRSSSYGKIHAHVTQGDATGVSFDSIMSWLIVSACDEVLADHASDLLLHISFSISISCLCYPFVAR